VKPTETPQIYETIVYDNSQIYARVISLACSTLKSVFFPNTAGDDRHRRTDFPELFKRKGRRTDQVNYVTVPGSYPPAPFAEEIRPQSNRTDR